MASIQQHLIMMWFSEFIKDNGFNDTSDLVEYIETLELEQITVAREMNEGIVECEAYRPYVIIVDSTTDDSSMHWAVHLPMVASVGWSKIHKLFKDYSNHKLSRLVDIEKKVSDIKYPVEPIPFSEYLNKDEIRAHMIYYIISASSIANEGLLDHRSQRYTIKVGGNCWGNLPNSSVYYMDEIMQLRQHNMRHSINWSDSPLKKYIILHKENVRLEKERIALLEKMERIKELTEKNKAYMSRKQRKYLKSRLNVINNKVENGLYFDYNRLSLLYEKVAPIMGGGLLSGTLNSIYTCLKENYQNENHLYTKIFRYIEDLFPDYNIITYEQFYSRYPNKQGFEILANPAAAQLMWFQELYMSGVDLSYYALTDEDLKKLAINMAHETTICLDLGKVGGPLSKSMYYRTIEDERPIGSGDLYYLPRWAFIDKRG